MAANWSELPDGLLENIFKRLVVSDHLSFMSVCSPWRLAVSHCNTLVRGYGGRIFVGLVVPGKSAHTQTRRLLQPSLRSSELYYDDDTDVLNIAVPHQYHCCGSKYGWLVLVDDSLHMHLFNPLSGSKIQLPSLTTANPLAWRVDKAGKFIVNKVFLSHNPSSSPSETFLLMIYYGVDMAFCRLGSDSWTVIEPLNDCRYNSDVVYYNEKFYVVYNPGGLVTIDIHAPSDEGVVQIEYAPKPPGEIFVQNRYLVESNGDLFQIRKIERHIDDDEDYASSYYTDSDDDGGGGNGNHGVDNDDNAAGGGGGDDDNGNQNANNNSDGDNEDSIVSSGGEADDKEKIVEQSRESLRSYRTKKFKIFKLRQCCCCSKQTWQKVKSIGDRAFFIGYHGSFSVSASELSGCRPNSIYFTDNNVYQLPRREPFHHDIGVYSLEDNIVQEVYPIHSKPVWPTAFWFSPFRGETS